MNASKFAGPEPISLYAEVENGRAEIRSSPGGGTEVSIEIAREGAPAKGGT